MFGRFSMCYITRPICNEFTLWDCMEYKGKKWYRKSPFMAIMYICNALLCILQEINYDGDKNLAFKSKLTSLNIQKSKSNDKYEVYEQKRFKINQ